MRELSGDNTFVVGLRVDEDGDLRFAISAGHEIPDVETVIETHGDWCVIEKDPSVSDLLKASDPRRQ